MLTKKQQFIKRTVDLTISMLLLPILVFHLLILVPLATLSTGKFGLFQQQRIGYLGKPFTFLKIRTLKGSDHKYCTKTYESETRFGLWLRKTKLDELPQIIHVLPGTMSLVGSRSDIPGYADKLIGDDKIILSIKPGITGPATIKYKNEDTILSQQPDPDTFNDSVIWPDKVAINKEYIKKWSFCKDVGYLFESLFSSVNT